MRRIFYLAVIVGLTVLTLVVLFNFLERRKAAFIEHVGYITFMAMFMVVAFDFYLYFTGMGLRELLLIDGIFVGGLGIILIALNKKPCKEKHPKSK